MTLAQGLRESREWDDDEVDGVLGGSASSSTEVTPPPTSPPASPSAERRGDHDLPRGVADLKAGGPVSEHRRVQVAVHVLGSGADELPGRVALPVDSEDVDAVSTALVEPGSMQLHLHPPGVVDQLGLGLQPRLLGLDLDRFERYSGWGSLSLSDWTAMVATTATTAAAAVRETARNQELAGLAVRRAVDRLDHAVPEVGRWDKGLVRCAGVPEAAPGRWRQE